LTSCGDDGDDDDDDGGGDVLSCPAVYIQMTLIKKSQLCVLSKR